MFSYFSEPAQSGTLEEASEATEGGDMGQFYPLMNTPFGNNAEGVCDKGEGKGGTYTPLAERIYKPKGLTDGLLYVCELGAFAFSDIIYFFVIFLFL